MPIAPSWKNWFPDWKRTKLSGTALPKPSWRSGWLKAFMYPPSQEMKPDIPKWSCLQCSVLRRLHLPYAYLRKRKLRETSIWKLPVILAKLSLRWHYPNQVIGSKATPSSQPVIQAPLYSIVEVKKRHPFGMPPVKNPCV